MTPAHTDILIETRPRRDAPRYTRISGRYLGRTWTAYGNSPTEAKSNALKLFPGLSPEYLDSLPVIESVPRVMRALALVPKDELRDVALGPGSPVLDPSVNCMGWVAIRGQAAWYGRNQQWANDRHATLALAFDGELIAAGVDRAGRMVATSRGNVNPTYTLFVNYAVSLMLEGDTPRPTLDEFLAEIGTLVRLDQFGQYMDAPSATGPCPT